MPIDYFFNDILGIKDRDTIAILQNMIRIIHFKKNEIIFNMGERPDMLAFLNYGVTRGYFVNPNGIEVTDCFDFRTGSPLVPSIPFDDVARVYIEACTDCELICFPMAEVIELIKENVFFIKLYNELLLESLRNCLDLKNVLHCYNTAERYQWFKENYPTIENIVKKKYIASFLGMTEEHLCRLRNSNSRTGH